MQSRCENSSLMCLQILFLVYRGPNLRRSLTDRETKYNPSESQASTYSLSSNETFESRGSKTESSGGGSPRHEARPMTQEDRLVDVITTPGGVRLQPSREAVQNFLTAAAKLDGDRLGHALQSKLQAHAWQVSIACPACLALYHSFELVFNALLFPVVKGSTGSVIGCQ